MTRSLVAALVLSSAAASAQDAGTPPPDAGVSAAPATAAPPATAGQPATAAPPQQPQVVYVPVPAAPPAAPEKEKEPEERVRHFYVSLQGGAGYINLSTVAGDGSVVAARNTGIYGGLLIGARFLKFLAVQIEGRIGHFLGSQTFDTILALAELRAQLPLGPLRLYGEAGGGFAYTGNFQGCPIGGNCPVSSRGYAFHLGAGLDIALGDAFWLGAGALFDTLNAGPFGLAGSSTANLMRPGDAAGLQTAFVGRATLNF